MTTQQQATSQTARDSYVAAHEKSQQLLGRIDDLLRDMPCPDEECVANWSHIADLGRVNELLSQAVVFLRGKP